MIKVGAMSICLEPLLEGVEPTPARILHAAAKAGIAGVEFYETHWGADPRDADGAEALKALGADLGVEVFAVGSGTRLGYGDERSRGAMETLKNQIRAAAAVGAGVVTFPAIDSQPVPEGRTALQGGLPFAQAVGPLVEQMQALAEFARDFAVRLALLNHCFFVGASWHQEWVVKLADRPEVGTCLDPGNYLYYECEDPVAATRRLAGTVCNVRLGDWVRRDERDVVAAFRSEGRLGIWAPAVFGTGEVDHGACLRILRESGYEGYLSLKSVGGDFRDSLEGVRALVEGANGESASDR
jgi:sugar phosphate isomerase/epimerase